MSKTRRKPIFILALIVTLLVIASLIQIGRKDIESETGAIESTTSSTPNTGIATARLDEFPAESLRSALSDRCADLAREARNQASTDAAIQAEIDSFDELRSTVSKGLSVSSSAEHLYLAALLEEDPESKISLIDDALARSPTDVFLLWGAVHVCAEATSATECSLRNWEQRLLALDGQNSESWIRVAASQYASGLLGDALESVRQAASAAESRAYWPETIEMVERGLAAGTNHGFSERAEMAFGIAASLPPRFNDYVSMCQKQSALSVDWAYACLAYGQLVEGQGRTDMGIAIALAVQEIALEALGEPDELASVRKRRDVFQAERRESMNAYSAAAEQSMYSDPGLFAAYLARIKMHGEAAARAYLASETERLLAENPELICE